MSDEYKQVTELAEKINLTQSYSKMSLLFQTQNAMGAGPAGDFVQKANDALDNNPDASFDDIKGSANSLLHMADSRREFNDLVSTTPALDQGPIFDDFTKEKDASLTQQQSFDQSLQNDTNKQFDTDPNDNATFNNDFASINATLNQHSNDFSNFLAQTNNNLKTSLNQMEQQAQQDQTKETQAPTTTATPTTEPAPGISPTASPGSTPMLTPSKIGGS